MPVLDPRHPPDDAPSGAQSAETSTPADLDGGRTKHAYRRGERPEVLVHVAGDWHPAELREWSQDRAGRWWAHVTWRRPLDQKFDRTFPRQRIWEDSEDVAPEARSLPRPRSTSDQQL